MIFKFRFKKLGGHVHYKLYAGPAEGSLGLAGNFVLAENEHLPFTNMLTRGSGAGGKTILVDEGEENTPA